MRRRVAAGAPAGYSPVVRRHLVTLALSLLAVACGAEPAGGPEPAPAPAPATPAKAAPASTTAATPADRAEAPPPAGCVRDQDCAPDHPCVPRRCVPREQAVADHPCEETGPPIGACVCVEGGCAEVPFDAPDGRDRARAAIGLPPER